MEQLRELYKHKSVLIAKNLKPMMKKTVLLHQGNDLVRVTERETLHAGTSVFLVFLACKLY